MRALISETVDIFADLELIQMWGGSSEAEIQLKKKWTYIHAGATTKGERVDICARRNHRYPSRHCQTQSHVILLDQKYALQFEYGLGKAAA